MIRLVWRRLLALVPTLLFVTFGVFLLVHVAPNDAATFVAGGTEASQADIAAARERLGLNEPLFQQYGAWLGNAVQGDFGMSYVSHMPVTEELKTRIPITLGLLLASTIFALVIAVPLGLVCGLRPNGWFDHSARILASLAVAIPSFLLALVLVIVFAVDLGWLPSSGYAKFSESPTEWLRFITLPAVALGFAIAAALVRQLRGALVDELDTNHIRTCWAIGSGPRRVVGRHALRNAAAPAITILGLQIAALVGGAVIVEQIFAIPGLGTYLLASISSYDIPAVLGCVVVLVVTQIVMSLSVDIAYAVLNPKVRVV